MQAQRREHALCFMHRHTLRNAGLVFTQEFQLDVLNSQLPLPLPSRPVEKCLRTFKAYASFVMSQVPLRCAAVTMQRGLIVVRLAG